MNKKKFLKILKEYVPGKSITEVAKEFGLNPQQRAKLRLHENLYWPSPYGPSPKVKKAIVKNLDKINVYSSDLTELSKKISKYIKRPTKNIVVDAGIDGVLDTLTKILLDKNDEVIIPVPTYEMFEFITRVNGGIPRLMQRDENFDIALNKLKAFINKRTKIIFLCSPNYPIGNTVKREQLEKILKLTKAFIVIDEAFGEFAENSAINLTKKFQNLIVLRTFSKVFGLAALRIGYGIVPEKIAKDFNKTKLPFSVNSLSVKAAIAALGDQEYIKKVVKTIKEGREYLLKAIKLKTYPSEANFVLVDVSPLKAGDVIFQLLKQGVLVRDCDSFERLRKNFIRVKVGKPSQNRKIVKVINNIYESFS